MERYIDNAWTHLQAYYCHESLGTKVTIERVGQLLPIDFRIKATEFMIRDLRLKLFTALNLGDADLMLYMGLDRDNKVNNGIAWIGTVCSHDPAKKLQKFSIVRFLESSTQVRSMENKLITGIREQQALTNVNVE